MLAIHTVGPKLMFWCISFHLGAFETICILHKTRCKMGQPCAIKAEVRAIKSRQKFSNECSRSTYWTLSSCFHAFLSIWVHLGPFRDHTKLKAKRAKLGQLMQKFVPWCPVRIFHNEHSRSTPLDPNLMFWYVSFHLCAFGTVSLLHKTRCKMGQPGAIKTKVCATMSCQNFSKWTLLIHIIGS